MSMSNLLDRLVAVVGAHEEEGAMDADPKQRRKVDRLASGEGTMESCSWGQDWWQETKAGIEQLSRR
jgi:hypothetical protein